MTTRKDDDLSREAGHDKARGSDEAEAEAKRAAREAAAACSDLRGYLLEYMNTFDRTLRRLDSKQGR